MENVASFERGPMRGGDRGGRGGRGGGRGGDRGGRGGGRGGGGDRGGQGGGRGMQFASRVGRGGLAFIPKKDTKPIVFDREARIKFVTGFKARK